METIQKIVKTRKKYDIKYHELNANKFLKESTLMLFLQDIASENAEINGFGYTWCEQNKTGWFLLKYRMELSKYPENMDYIEIESESRGVQKLFAFRDFTIYSPDESVIGCVASCWALIDFETKSMISPLKINPDFQLFEKREDDLSFNKLRMPESFDYQKTYGVRFDDLDVNLHANNSNYMVWALETLPYEFRKQYNLKNLDIQYKKDISIGESVLALSSIDNETLKTYHSLKNASTQEELAILTIDWQ